MCLQLLSLQSVARLMPTIAAVLCACNAHMLCVCASRTLFCSASAAYVTRMRQVFSCVCFALPRMRCTGSAFLPRTVTQFHAYAYTLVTGFKHVAPFLGENSWIILSLCRHTTYCGHLEARRGPLFGLFALCVALHHLFCRQPPWHQCLCSSAGTGCCQKRVWRLLIISCHAQCECGWRCWSLPINWLCVLGRQSSASRQYMSSVNSIVLGPLRAQCRCSLLSQAWRCTAHT